MKVKLLLLEDVEREIDEEIRNQLSQNKLSSKERDYQNLLSEISGEKTENEVMYVDISKYYKITDFYFKKENVNSLFMSSKLVNGEKVMVITLQNEYDCIYDEVVFEEIKQYLNN